MVGSVGLPELLIIIVVLAGIVLVIGSLFRCRKKRAPGGQSGRLKELQRMKQEGLISEEEYSKKRKEIIDSL